MSIYGVAWALDRVRGISVGAKIVLISLAEFANEQDVTWVSRERLISRVECSTRALSGYFKELEACGALTREAATSGARPNRARVRVSISIVVARSIGFIQSCVSTCARPQAQILRL